MRSYAVKNMPEQVVQVRSLGIRPVRQEEKEIVAEEYHSTVTIAVPAQIDSKVSGLIGRAKNMTGAIMIQDCPYLERHCREVAWVAEQNGLGLFASGNIYYISKVV